MSKAIAFVRSGAAPDAQMEVYTDPTDATVATQWTAVQAGAFSGGAFNGISVKYARYYTNCTVSNTLNDSSTTITASAVSPAYDPSTGVTGQPPATNIGSVKGNNPRNLVLLTNNLALVNGANNNVAITDSYNRISAPTGVFNITGLTVGADSISSADGFTVILDNVTGQNMTITNESSSSAAANRIVTNTGADVATTGNGSITLVYNAFDSRWHMAAGVGA